MVAQVVGDLLVGGDEAAERCERLAECAHDQIHIVLEAEMVYGAAAAGAEHSYAVGFVDHHAGVVLLGQTHDLGYVGHVTFHREYAVGHDELDLVGITLLKLGLRAMPCRCACTSAAGRTTGVDPR